MIREGFFVTQQTRTRQSYRVEPLYRHTFTVLAAIGGSILLTVLVICAGKFFEGAVSEQQNQLAGQEAEINKEEDRQKPVVDKITALGVLRRRIEKRTPASRVLSVIESAVLSSPNICLRQIDLESTSDEKKAADIDHWTILIQAVTRATDRQTISDFKDLLAKEFNGAPVGIIEQPNLSQAQPRFSLQIQYPQ